jgi:hypothetical protein
MGDRGFLQLPRWLLGAIASLGLSAFAVGLYLENSPTGWLAGHPFTTNMLSSIVGFSAVTFTVGIGFSLIARRAEARSAEVVKHWMALRDGTGRVVTEIVGQSAPRLRNAITTDEIARVAASALRPYPPGRPDPAVRRVANDLWQTIAQAESVLVGNVQPIVDRLNVSSPLQAIDANRRAAGMAECLKNAIHWLGEAQHAGVSGVERELGDKGWRSVGQFYWELSVFVDAFQPDVVRRFSRKAHVATQRRTRALL